MYLAIASRQGPSMFTGTDGLFFLPCIIVCVVDVAEVDEVAEEEEDMGACCCAWIYCEGTCGGLL